MNDATPAEVGTVFEALLASLRAAAKHNESDVVAPVAILWTDEKREWERLVPRLREAMPRLLVLGAYDPANRVGPAIWIRCVLAGKIEGVPLSPDGVPILYLPGVGKAGLRATDECPPELKPIAELQYRGVLWTHPNGKDWTATAFLQGSRGGLGLKIGRDAATAESVLRALPRLMDVPLFELRQKSERGELTATYFDELISGDLVDDLLTWLSDPKGTQARWDSEQWETLRSRCVRDYGFDPIRDGELAAAEKLGRRPATAAWGKVWKRYATAPGLYPGVEESLRKGKPQGEGDLFASVPSEPWPQDNEAEESALRKALLALEAESPGSARAKLRELEARHGVRREWVWSNLGRAPLAGALCHLATLADATATPLSAETTEGMIAAHVADGWRTDAAATDALAVVSGDADSKSVAAAIAAVYTPWLRDTAELFQERIAANPLPGSDVPRRPDVPAETCVLFADGLRFDVACKLRSALEASGRVVEMSHHVCALPGVTSTAKPAVSPVADRLGGGADTEEFRPVVAGSSATLTTDRFRALLDERGVPYLSAEETGEPDRRAWTEFGKLDAVGHDEGVGLARRIPEMTERLRERINGLLDAGWNEVVVVTDHGWLLVPGGMPKVELPKYLTETRWGRCAILKDSANVALPTFAWHWDGNVRVASAPGIGCFKAGMTYAHGGLSLQECVVPRLCVKAPGTARVNATIADVRWAGLRCRVRVTGEHEGCSADLRDRAGDPATSLTQPKPVGTDGNVSLVVENDEREGTPAILALLDPAGNVINRRAVIIGAGE